MIKIFKSLNKIPPILSILSLVFGLILTIFNIIYFYNEFKKNNIARKINEPKFDVWYVTLPLDDFRILLKGDGYYNKAPFFNYPILENEITKGILDTKNDTEIYEKWTKLIETDFKILQRPNLEINNNMWHMAGMEVTLLILTQNGKIHSNNTKLELLNCYLDSNTGIEIFANNDVQDDYLIKDLLEYINVIKPVTIELGNLSSGDGRIIPLFISGKVVHEVEWPEFYRVSKDIVKIPNKISYSDLYDDKEKFLIVRDIYKNPFFFYGYVKIRG